MEWFRRSQSGDEAKRQPAASDQAAPVPDAAPVAPACRVSQGISERQRQLFAKAVMHLNPVISDAAATAGYQVQQASDQDTSAPDPKRMTRQQLEQGYMSLHASRLELLEETLSLRRELLTLQQQHLATLQQLATAQQQTKQLQEHHLTASASPAWFQREPVSNSQCSSMASMQLT